MYMYFATDGSSGWNSLSDPARNPNATEAAFSRPPTKDIFVCTTVAHQAT